MSQKLKTDLALYATAFVASLLMLGAETGFAHIVGAIVAAR